jgi:ATP-dependent DNA helicase RecQ
MLACPADRITLENFTYGDTPTAESVESLMSEVLSLGEVFDVATYDLSGKHDMRPLVVETLMTYLQLDGILASTGPFYSEYKFQANRPLETVFAGYDAKRAEFLRKVFAQARRAKTWSHIDVHEAALSIGEPRDRVVAAVNYLEEQGDLVLQVAGVRHGYRLLKTPSDWPALVRTMTQRFADRERRDVERLAAVLAFAAHPGCKTRHLLEYFGEPVASDCGHCGWCRGHRPAPLSDTRPTKLGDREIGLIDEMRAESQPALGTPRQLARFLCGLPSPSASKAKLNRHALFGALGHLPFHVVMKRLEAQG